MAKLNSTIFKQLPTMVNDLNKLGGALKSLDAMKFETVGVNLGNIDAYRNALKGLSVEQSVFALSSKGATEEQIRQILVTDQAIANDVEAALAKAGLTTATKALNAEELISLATKKGISTERAKEIASALGLIATEEGQIVSKKQLTVATLKQIGATDAEITAILGVTAAEGGAIVGTNLLTAAFAKLNRVIKSNPYLFVIGAALTAIIASYEVAKKKAEDAEEAIVEAHENAQQALEETRNSLSNDKSELESVNSELETTKERIKEISSIGAPTLAEQNELTKLSTTNAQLEAQQALLENNIKLKQKSAAMDAKELLDTQVEMNYSDILDGTSVISKTESYTYTEHAKYEASNLKNAYNIYMNALKEGNSSKQALAQELIDSSSGNIANLTTEILDIVDTFKYDDGTIIEGYESLYNEYMGMIYNLQSLTNPDTFLDIAKSVTSNTGIDYETAVAEAYKLAYEGNFDIKDLNQEFVKALTDSGIDESTINYIFKLKQQEYQLLVNKIDEKYKVSNIPEGNTATLRKDYWNADGTITSEYVEVDITEDKKHLEEINSINETLNDYARENPIEFQLIASYDEDFSLLDKYIEEEKEKITGSVSTAQENLQDEYAKIEKWGLGDYADQIKNGTIQSVFGNVDMDKRTIITWSDELKQTYQDELASWDYDPEIGTIDTVYGMSGRFGESLSDNGWEVAFTPILPDGTFLSADTVYGYIEAILQQAYADDGQVTDEELKAIDAQGMQIGDTFVKGIYAGIDGGLNYDNNGNWAETVGRLMHFSGDFGAVNLAEQAIEEAENSSKNSVDNIETYTKDAIERVYNDAKVKSDTFNNETAVSFTEQISEVQKLSAGLDQLDSIMADVVNGEEFDWSSILNNDDFKEAFGDYGEAYDDFIKTISESPDDLEKCQSAFDDLATAYVYQSGLLKNLTEETKDATVNMLSEMGIANAEEVVNSFLNGYTEAIRLAEAANIDFTNATAEEIYALQGLENEFVTAGDSAFNYYLRKKLCSETSINTVADCNALIALAEQCKVTGENLQLLIQLRNIYNVLESDIWSEETKQLATKEAEKIKAQLNNLNVSINAEYDGGSKVKSALKETEKDVEDTTEKSQAAFKKLMDAELAVLDARMEAGLLKYDDYLKQRLALIESYKGKVADADYYSAIVDNYENELSYMDKVANAIDRIIDKKIDAYNEEIEALEKAHEAQMEALETEIEKWEEKKELLQEQNDALEKQKNLEQALYDLERAQSQRSQLVYSGSDRGFIYKQDQEAIRDAQESVRQAKLDIELDNIDKEIERLQKQQDELEEILDSKREAIEKDIESLEEYRDKWSEVSEQYTNSQEDMILSAMYGANAENDILNQRMDILTSFTERYEELQQRQADARLKLAEAEVEAARIEAENLANKESSSTASSSNNNSSSFSSIAIPSEGTFFTYSILDRTTKKPVIDDVYETYAEAKLKRKELNNQGYDCYVKSNKYVDGVLKYHNGILGGIVGEKYDNLSDFEVIKRNSLNPDEISAVLQKGEVVLTQDQQHNLAENLKNIDFNPFVNINIPDYTQMLQNIAIREPAQSINVSIGDIQLHGVQNTDTLTDAIIREMPGKIIQKIHR